MEPDEVPLGVAHQGAEAVGSDARLLLDDLSSGARHALEAGVELPLHVQVDAAPVPGGLSLRVLHQRAPDLPKRLT